jgi:tRNA uridine 5-carboxymethylaminomethyl modification enzyme
MFTSRAEYRLLLRQDNADVRLMRKGHRLGLVPAESLSALEKKERRVKRGMDGLRRCRVNGSSAPIGSGPLSGGSATLEQLLRRPEVALSDLLALPQAQHDRDLMELAGDPDSAQQVEIEVKYEGYLRRQEEQVEQFSRNEAAAIPESFDYREVRSLSSEAREKLMRVRPRSLGQASRISGVTPADVAVLMVTLFR